MRTVQDFLMGKDFYLAARSVMRAMHPLRLRTDDPLGPDEWQACEYWYGQLQANPEDEAATEAGK